MTDITERLLTANDNLRMEITALLHIADRDEAEIKRLREENGRLNSHNKELLYDNEQKFAELQRLQEQVLALQHIADRDEAEIERMRIKVYQLENDLTLTRAMLPTKYKYEAVRMGVKE